MMQMRDLGASGLSVSEVGLGCEHLQGQPLKVVEAVVDAALSQGITILDTFMSEPEVRTNLGIALKGRREQAVLQGHIGAAWENGQYLRTTSSAKYHKFFDDYRKRLQTDYVDIGMLHFVDTDADYDAAFSDGMVDYAQKLKAQGVIRTVGVSSHSPLVARRLVESGAIDVLMFSLNPAFDVLPPEADIDALFKPDSYTSQDTFSITPERLALYQACEARGIGITVMKALGGGALVDAKASPFGVALSVHQCIHYALTRPAVASVLIGCRTPEEVAAAVAYETADDAARDYAPVLAQSTKYSMQGRCVYCNHCLPCPSRIDIAQVNKYLDLAAREAAVPDTVRSHYAALAKKASDCIRCGQCEPRCPFAVPVMARMDQATALLG